MKIKFVSIVLSLLLTGQLSAQVMKKYNLRSTFSKQEIVEDIDYMIKSIEEVHPNPYHSISKNNLMLFTDSIINNLPDSVDKFSALKIFREITAKYKEGHTALDLWSFHNDISKFEKVFPLVLVKDEHGIISENKYNDIEAGDIIVSVNGKKIENIISSISKYYGDNLSFSINYILDMFPFWLEMEHIYAPYSIHYKRNGKEKQTVLQGINYTDYEHNAQNNENNQDEDYTFSILDNKIGYINFTAFQNPEKFRDFSRATFDTIKKSQLIGVIL